MAKLPQSLSQQASRGAFWALASNITVSAISFVGTAILARILEPKDFGLIGMAGLVTGVVHLFGNFGLGAALIQKKDVSDEDLSTVFWANLVAGLALTVACILIAPLAANFFNESAVIWVLTSLAFTFLVSSLSSVHNTLIYKRIQMKPLAVIEVVGRVLRVAAMLIAAFCGLQFWSIVIGMILERVYKTTAFFFLEPWRPSRVFSGQRFKAMFRFGRNLFAEGFLNYLNQNMDFIVTGRILGAELLGLYQMAFNLPSLLKGYIESSIGAVAFPVFCEVQDDDERLVRGVSKIIRFIAIGTFPLLAGLLFTAHDFIFVVYGERWLPTVAPMQILCFSAALTSINTVIGPLLNAKGRPDLGLKWGCVRLPATVIAILLGVYWGELIGVAWGMLVVEVLSLAMVYQVLRILKAGMKEYATAIVPATAASLVMILVLVGINLSLQECAAVTRLLIDIVAGGAVYVVVVILGFRETFRDFLKFISSIAKKPGQTR